MRLLLGLMDRSFRHTQALEREVELLRARRNDGSSTMGTPQPTQVMGPTFDASQAGGLPDQSLEEVHISGMTAVSLIETLASTPSASTFIIDPDFQILRRLSSLLPYLA